MICNNCKDILSKINSLDLISNEPLSCSNPGCVILYIHSEYIKTTDYPQIRSFIKNVYSCNDREEIEITSIAFPNKWDWVYYICSDKENFQNAINDFIKKYEYFSLLD